MPDSEPREGYLPIKAPWGLIIVRVSRRENGATLRGEAHVRIDRDRNDLRQNAVELLPRSVTTQSRDERKALATVIGLITKDIDHLRTNLVASFDEGQREQGVLARPRHPLSQALRTHSDAFAEQHADFGIPADLSTLDLHDKDLIRLSFDYSRTAGTHPVAIQQLVLEVDGTVPIATALLAGQIANGITPWDSDECIADVARRLLMDTAWNNGQLIYPTWEPFTRRRRIPKMLQSRPEVLWSEYTKAVARPHNTASPADVAADWLTNRLNTVQALRDQGIQIGIDLLDQEAAITLCKATGTAQRGDVKLPPPDASQPARWYHTTIDAWLLAGQGEEPKH